MTHKIGESTANKAKAAGNRGNGRKKGVPNKVTKALKDAILGALEEAGGAGGSQAYLLRQARKKNPMAFMALVGKVLPLKITGEDGGPLQVKHMSDAELLAIIANAKQHG